MVEYTVSDHKNSNRKTVKVVIHDQTSDADGGTDRELVLVFRERETVAHMNKAIVNAVTAYVEAHPLVVDTEVEPEVLGDYTLPPR